jgi:DNA helicase HerA-like ATPase
LNIEHEETVPLTIFLVNGAMPASASPLTMRRPLRVPRNAENKHFLVVGDTGSGKSSVIRQMLYQVADRGDSAIVYDPACEFVKQLYDERRGDIVLNPLDARMPYWNPSDELRRIAFQRGMISILTLFSRFLQAGKRISIYTRSLTNRNTPTRCTPECIHPV